MEIKLIYNNIHMKHRIQLNYTEDSRYMLITLKLRDTTLNIVLFSISGIKMIDKT